MSTRPEVLPSETHAVRMECGKLYITLSRNEKGEVVEVFANVGKEGCCQRALLTGACRQLSMALRTQKPGLRKRLASVWAGIPCPGAPPGDPATTPTSCLDMIARLIDGDV